MMIDRRSPVSVPSVVADGSRFLMPVLRSRTDPSATADGTDTERGSLVNDDLYQLLALSWHHSQFDL